MFSDNHQLGGSSIAFPGYHPIPFPENADFFHDHLTPSPGILQLPPPFPPQKLRPIRSHSQLQSNSVASLAQRFNGDCTSPELGFMSESPLTFPDSQPHSPIPLAPGGADNLVAALRQIDPAEGFDYAISELKKQIPPLDSTSSSSEDSVKRSNRKKRKRMESYLKDLMMQVMNKQEQMHKQLIEEMEKREADRVIREEAWRRQENELAKKEKAIRAEEVSRSLALISFIQKAMDGHKIQLPSLPSEEGYHKINSSKKTWPKSEVQSLIALRCALDVRFRDVASKNSLWKEISVGLTKMGYRRSARNCRDKWRYINEYYKSCNENGGSHSEIAKDCPYFQELEILYRNGFIN